MAEVGEYNKLEIARKVEHGMYLLGEGENDILLPNQYVPETANVGDEIEVFVYRDSEDRIIATTLKPYAIVGEFAFLKVIASTAVGAFLDWGLPKDLLVPFKEQQDKMFTGRSYVVYVFLDEESDRVVATTRFNRFLNKQTSELSVGQEVELLIQKQTDLGYQAIVNNSFKGMIFENEIFEAVQIGQKTNGFIKQIRPDGKLDLILQKTGFGNIDPVVEKILDYLKSQGGSMDITDKSPAETIYIKFGVSKRAFKQAIGTLYKKRMIKIEKNQISLI